MLTPVAANAPQQDRSRASLERLMHATREILNEGTFEQLTIAGISKRSKVSVGSIYARFKGKEELFLAVMIDVMTEMEREWAQEIAVLKTQQLSLNELVPALIDRLAEHLHRHASILKPFMTKASDPRVAACGKATHLKTEQAFQELLLEQRDFISHPEPERAVVNSFVIAYSALARFLGLGSAPDAAGEGSWDHLKKDLGQMCLGFLKQSHT
ncbi:TetR/AcrR family transcriptional regulator [Pseudomonas putida]|uniref:TetR/AcrR family transcriptional regulator n=1 Tax=Pseudomonas putida TaxID=303 RepID=UPI002763643A|nr:TetR/AcrR family transcriptional regulator [Pseudomonas putida]MDP9522897.1 TetR/AcrR family transcriptional regulator [Pseudomonas putida]